MIASGIFRCDDCDIPAPVDVSELYVRSRAALIKKIRERGWWSNFEEADWGASTELCPRCKPELIS